MCVCAFLRIRLARLYVLLAARFSDEVATFHCSLIVAIALSRLFLLTNETLNSGGNWVLVNVTQCTSTEIVEF